jgi:hypothetical protein
MTTKLHFHAAELFSWPAEASRNSLVANWFCRATAQYAIMV